jgi:hypothetical protein
MLAFDFEDFEHTPTTPSPTPKSTTRIALRADHTPREDFPVQVRAVVIIYNDGMLFKT